MPAQQTEIDMGANAEFEDLPLKTYTERAYFDYAMYVINDRALPHIADGLKPVQRRIIYAMGELGLDSKAKFAKSARTVGDVLGKFHPHGDSACYEAMVLMAQPFSFRYPLIEGQGNWGASDDPKSFAAMRYTEARLSAYARLLLDETRQGTVDFLANFDGSRQEPALLPAQVPMLLLNGTTGIAVGMATDIPPHNMTEVINACIHLLEKPKATLDDILAHIQGPDFPTEANIITSADDMRTVYATGQGSIKARAQWRIEDNAVVIHALPYQASPAKVLEQIAAQMQAGKLPMLDDLRDESDHNQPTRLILTLRSKRTVQKGQKKSKDQERLMLHLFATTDLEKSYRVNMNVIGLDGRPQVKHLITFLKEWLQYRQTTLQRRLQFRLDKICARRHVLDGLMVAYQNLAEVIRIIREAEKPKATLMQTFDLTEIQASAILDLRLRQLARLEEHNLLLEIRTLQAEQEKIEKTLKSKARMKTFLRKELHSIATEYSDVRKSPIISAEPAIAFSENELIVSEPVTAILSQKGWIRAAKGHDIKPEALAYRSGDTFAAAACGQSNERLILLDSTGRAYSLNVASLPSARSQGEPLTGRFKPPPGARFVSLALGPAKNRVLIASNSGYGFIATFEMLDTRAKAGRACLTVPKNAATLPFCCITGHDTHVAVLTNTGYLLAFEWPVLPELNKGKGVKLIQMPSADEHIIGAVTFGKKDDIIVHAGTRHCRLKPKQIADYLGDRARRGRRLPRGFQRANRLEIDKRP